MHSHRPHHMRLATLLLAGIFCPPGVSLAQTITATLRGVVEDPTGARVPGADVRVKNSDTNVEQRVSANAEGGFAFSALPPGRYALTVQSAGFKSVLRDGIVLSVNQLVDLSVRLELGETGEIVNVTAAPPLVETGTAAIGQVIDEHSIVNLPLNQRNVYALVFLAPGVYGTVGTQFNSDNISINGGRPGSNEFLIDGIPSSPPLVNPIQGFSVYPSVESIQEFKVQSNSYSVEFGRTGGGLLNMIFKSGTNNIHGSAYDFLRNSDLDANGFFANKAGTPLASFKRNQFGASVGGPVVLPKIYNGKNKTFFFAAYEGLRQSSPSSTTATVPTDLQKQGDFSQTYNAAGKLVGIYDPSTTTAVNGAYTRQLFAGNVIPGSRLNTVGKNLMQYYPRATQPGALYTGANNYYASGSSATNTDQYDAKVDENLNDRNRFFVRFSRRNLDAPAATYFPAAVRLAQGGVNQPQISNSAAVDYTYTPSSTLLFDLRYGFARTLLNFSPVSSGFDPTQLGLPSYIAATADSLMFPGFAASNYVSLGNGGPDFRHNSFASHSFSANNTKVFSRHTIKFGGEARLGLVNVRESAAADGNFSFSSALTQGPDANTASTVAGNSIASLLLGLGSGSLTLHSKDASTRSKYYALYLGDDWAVSSRLTLNAGIRFDVEVPRAERHDRMNVFDPSVASPLSAQAGISVLGGLEFPNTNGLGSKQFDTTTSWEPRFGFAYKLSAKTSIRGGYGLFYAPSYRQAAGTLGSTGYSSTTSYQGTIDGITPANYLTNPFPTGIVPVSGKSNGLLTGIGGAISAPLRGDNSVPYVQNWSFSVQRELPGNILIDAAYVGNHGLHLNKAGETDYNLNQLTAEQLQLGTGLQSKVANPYQGLITTGALAAATVPRSYLLAPYSQYTAVYASFLTGGYSIYHSAQLKLEKRFSSGLSFLASFTAQKSIDDYSMISNVGTGAGIQNIYNDAGERSVSANDRARNFTLSVVYSLPFGRGKRYGSQWNRLTDAALGGWQVNGIATYQSGLPLALTTQNTSGAGGNSLRPNNNGSSAELSGSVESRLNRYFDTSVFSQPAPFTFGNTGRTLADVRGPANRNIDLSLFKNFSLWERTSLQFRAEAFNLPNTPVFSSPNTTFSSTSFGIISSQANSPRQIQFGLKLLF